jgi:formylglycine-generating enzyme required for sulfatase activity
MPDQGDSQPTKQDVQKPAQPVEHLCINSPKIKDIVQETVQDAVEDAVQEIVPELAEEPILEEPPIQEEQPAEEQPITEQPAEETPVEEAPVEETPKPEPVDPFASLSEEEKTRLDKVREEKQAVIEALLDRMVKVEGGTFTMGADPKPNDTRDTDGKERGMVENNESPKHEVTLSTYFIAALPVTQELWSAVMGNNPSDCKDKLTYHP